MSDSIKFPLGLRSSIANNRLMHKNNNWFVKLYDHLEVYDIYKRVFTKVAAEVCVGWREIYNFDENSRYYEYLCVALILIHDAIVYYGQTIDSALFFLQPEEAKIIKSYYNIQ